MKGRIAMLVATSMAAMLGAQTADAGHSASTTVAQSKKASLQSDVQRSSLVRALLGGGIGLSGSRQRRAGFGWTNMHARRMALKKRNQAKHRRTQRGRGGK